MKQESVIEKCCTVESGNFYYLPTIEDFTDFYSSTIFVSSLVHTTEKFLADIALHE